jgi:hypothetical protein
MLLFKLALLFSLATAQPSILNEGKSSIQTDPAAAADIPFKTFSLAGTKLQFGIALPKTPSPNGDFIGQIVSF